MRLAGWQRNLKREGKSLNTGCNHPVNRLVIDSLFVLLYHSASTLMEVLTMTVYKAGRSCRLTDDLYLKAKYIADMEKRSFNNWLEHLITTVVDEYEKEHGTILVQPDDLYE